MEHGGFAYVGIRLVVGMTKAGCGHSVWTAVTNPREFNSVRRRDGERSIVESPDHSGQYHAEIDAAWLDGDGSVKIAVHDPFGNTKELYLTHVSLR